MALDRKEATRFGTETSELPVGFGHHVIYADEKFDEMVKWYQTLLSGDITTMPDSAPADLLVREDIDAVVIAKRPGLTQERSPIRTGIFHVAWSYSSLAELMTVYQHAKANGILPLEVLNTGILLQVYYIDPEGNGIELQVDAHDTSEATQVAQRSGRREGSVAHWVYDPETILRLMEAGWSDYDILDHEKYHAAAKSGRF